MAHGPLMARTLKCRSHGNSESIFWMRQVGALRAPWHAACRWFHGNWRHSHQSDWQNDGGFARSAKFSATDGEIANGCTSRAAVCRFTRSRGTSPRFRRVSRDDTQVAGVGGICRRKNFPLSEVPFKVGCMWGGMCPADQVGLCMRCIFVEIQPEPCTHSVTIFKMA
jgi:hypothetical protein